MKKSEIVLIFLLVISNTIFAQVCVLYQIPEDHLDGYPVSLVSETWAQSGTNSLPLSNSLDDWILIDVTNSGFDIFPNGNPCGQNINNLLNSLPPLSPSKIALLYFPTGNYLIEKTINLNKYTILKGAGGNAELDNQTHFYFDLNDDYENPCIVISNNHNGIEDIHIKDETGNLFITVNTIPIQFSNGKLEYCVENASEMYTIVTCNNEVICEGSGQIKDCIGTFECTGNLNLALTYNITTVFSNFITSETVNHIITPNKNNYGEGLYSINEDTLCQMKEDEVKLDGFYQYTIVINGDNNWIQGVECDMTRKFHVNVAGTANNNTIAGCYFFDAHDHSDNGGRGYGVCLGGNSFSNRVEDNIFKRLRHSMVIQGDGTFNVVGYNYSLDLYATGGNPFYKEADLLLHGRPSSSYDFGPKLNLLEGNVTFRARVDYVDPGTKEPNGPFNTFFRGCTTDDFFKISKADNNDQYRQNVVGCNMEPKGKTLSWLDDFGFRDYYNDGLDYKNIPSDYCSFYYFNKPSFIPDWMEWPFMPNVWAENPARFRYNYASVPNAIFQDWNNFENLCAPPVYIQDGGV